MCGEHGSLLRLGFGVYGCTLSAALFFAQKLRRELDVGDGVVVREEVELLEHQPEMQPLFADVRRILFRLRAAVKEHFAVHGDGAFVRRFKEIEAAEQRRLAAARRADDGKHFAAIQLEIDAFQHLVRPETLFQSFHFEYCHITPYSSSTFSR